MEWWQLLLGAGMAILIVGGMIGWVVDMERATDTRRAYRSYDAGLITKDELRDRLSRNGHL
jgi:hypothetical protein